MDAWPKAYDKAGLSWDDPTTNNRAFLSDQIAVTINGSSVYLSAVAAAAGASTAGTEIVVDPDDIWHAMIPGGPAGQFANIGSRSLAAMNYSPNADLAMEFLDWWFQEDQFINLVNEQGLLHPDGRGVHRSDGLHREPGPRPPTRRRLKSAATRATPDHRTRRRRRRSPATR